MQEFFDYQNFTEVPPEITEKKSIRRLAKTTGLALCGLFAIMFFWSLVFLRVMAVFGFNQKATLLLLNEPVIMQVLQILISGIMLFLPFFIAVKALNLKVRNLVMLKKPSSIKNTIMLAVMGLAFCQIVNVATNIGAGVFQIFGITFPDPQVELPKGIFGIIIMFFSTAFFPAFFEEFVMRGMLLGILKQKGNTFAVLCSALVFGFMHANAQQIVFAFFVGIILGFLTVKTESIWPAVAVHFLNNLISVIFSYLNVTKINENIISLAYVLLFAVVLLFGILFAIKISKNDNDFFKLHHQSEFTTQKKVCWFVTSPIIIISFVVSLLLAFFAR